MQLIPLGENTWVIQGGANIGIIAYEGRCLIIDSGLDKDAGRDILKQLKKLDLTPTALLVTHAHADLFSGAKPPRELQHKFLLAKPCLADTILQGNEQEVDYIPLQVMTLAGHSTE